MQVFSATTELFARASFAENDLCKACGLWWNPTAKRWAVTMDRLPRLLPGQLSKLAGYADDPKAKELLNGLTTFKVASVAASRATTTDVVIPAPAGLEYLGFQRAGIAFAMGRPAVLIADEMGLGKTIQALGVINADATIKTVLVVCPASLKLNWAREAAKWVAAGCTVSVEDADGTSVTTVTGAGGVRIHIANYEALVRRADLQALRTDMMVADEAHYTKNQKAKRTIAVHAAAKNTRRRVLLTGTPIVNRPVELFSLLSMLDPNLYGEKSFFRYAKRYCDAKQVWTGSRTVWDFTGASNLDELQEQLRGTMMVRRLKADVLKELPAKRRQVVILPRVKLSAASQKLVDSMTVRVEAARAAIEAAAILEDTVAYAAAVAGLDKSFSAGFEELSMLRHEQALAKVPHAAAHVVESLTDNDNKVIVFAHHQDVIEKMSAALAEFGVVTVTGKTAMVDRQAAVDRFQTDPTCRVFIGNMQAAGVGLTLTASAHVVFVELDWVPGTVMQAEDRAHRIGQRNSVLVQQLVCDGSIDAMFAEALVEKQRVIDLALDAQHSESASTVAIANAERLALEIQAAQDIKAAKAKAVSLVPADEKAAILAGLQFLAGRCDGAVEEDFVGFNGLHTHFGKSLARNSYLTDRQAQAGKKILNVYRNTQLATELVARIWGAA